MSRYESVFEYESVINYIVDEGTEQLLGDYP